MRIKPFFIIFLLMLVLALGSSLRTSAAPQEITIVTTLEDEADGFCDDGDCSLRDAITAVQSGASIEIPLSGTLQLTLGPLIIGKNMKILGPGADLLTIDAQGESRVFNIESRMDVTLRDMTITNGKATNGGGILNLGILTLERCTLSGNIAVSEGGGIYNKYPYGVLTVKQSSFLDNQAEYGGGLKNLSARADLWNCTFRGNIATSRGGGVDNDQWEDYPPSSVEIKNCTFSENTHGGVVNQSSATMAYNTIIAGNLDYECLGAFDAGTFFNNLATDDSCTPGFLLASLSSLRLDWQGWVYALLPGSTAIDTGGTGCLSIDQLGTPRPQDGDGNGTAICDIGAYERPTPPPPEIKVRLYLPFLTRHY